MKEWIRAVWADIPGRIALVLLVVSTIPAWFIWPGQPAMEAINALVIAGFLLTTWSRGLIWSTHRLIGVGVVVASAGLVIEAALFIGTGSRPLPVVGIFLTGMLLIGVVGLIEHRQGRSAV